MSSKMFGNRVHLQEDGYSMIRFTYIGISILVGRRVISTQIRGFIFRKTVKYTLCYGTVCIYMHKYKQSSR